jgi:hypothetical protein
MEVLASGIRGIALAPFLHIFPPAVAAESWSA